MRQTPEEFHDAAMLAALAGWSESHHSLTRHVATGRCYEAQMAAIANSIATALLAHRLPDPAPAQPTQPEQWERWFGFVNIPGSLWRFGSQYGAGRFYVNGRDTADSVYTLEQAERGLMGLIELSPATGLPLKQDKPHPDARAVVSKCEKAITDLLAIIGDDLTHKRQNQHAQELGMADAARDIAREFLKT